MKQAKTGGQNDLSFKIFQATLIKLCKLFIQACILLRVKLNNTKMTSTKCTSGLCQEGHFWTNSVIANRMVSLHKF